MASVDISNMSPLEFGRMFQRFKEKYILLAYSYVRDMAVSEDIVCEVFASFWTKRTEIGCLKRPEAYLLKMVRNMCLNHLRSEASRKKLDADVIELFQADMAILSNDDPDKLFSEDIQRIFHDTISCSSPLGKAIFMTSRNSDKTYQEIARQYNVSQRKVKREIHNTLESLRISLKDYLD